jgi:hypothetical protein
MTIQLVRLREGIHAAWHLLCILATSALALVARLLSFDTGAHR